MNLYLDTCCFNRVFDDQSLLPIRLQTEAIVYIQNEIESGIHSLVWSYVLDYEISRNPFADRREFIKDWGRIAKVSVFENEDVLRFARECVEKGLKSLDALHVACAKVAGCDCFISTDKRILNKTIPGIRMLDPTGFVLEEEENRHAH